MGMSASQARLGELTTRQNDIKLSLIDLSEDKMSLTRASEIITKNYRDALNAKKYVWSTNAGASYSDLNYKTLMHPGVANNNKPYLISDLNNRIVLDNEYAKYAEMISPNGKPADWESVRAEVLSAVTGISEARINAIGIYSTDAKAAQEALEALVEPTVPYERDFNKLLMKAGSSVGSSKASGFSEGKNWAEAYKEGATINLGTGTGVEDTIANILTHLNKTIGIHMADPDKFEAALNSLNNNYTNLIKNNNGKDINGATLSGNNSDGYKINVKSLIDEIMGAYVAKGGKTHTVEGSSRTVTQYLWCDLGSEEHDAYLEKKAAYDIEYAEKLAIYNAAIGNNGALLTAEEETKINFYEDLFSSVADRGWVLNNQVADSNYLNQMFQNNVYTISTVEREQEYSYEDREYYWDNDYMTDIASNCTNIFAVNDDDTADLALAEYEYQKSLINAKETKIDTRMRTLQTEFDANAQIIDELKTIINDNIGRTMNTMG